MLAFVRANRLNHIVLSGGRNPKIGIITVGKSYLDVREALDELGLDEVKANDMGVRLYKVACPWPLSQRELVEFASGLDLVIVVEEKRSLIEVQVREELYGTASQPVCIGKKDEEGRWLFPIKGALDANDIAVAIGERLLRYHRNDDLAGRVRRLKEVQTALAEAVEITGRTPHFCSGCPHNSSTVVPEGMRAYAGIGCHFMSQWMDRSTDGFTQMGGEGANWVGESNFSKREHVFQNLGDGTYNHSGSLALRWAAHTKTNVTYKILFNDAVAMTGGQPHEGQLTVDMIANQVRAEGVERIALVTDEPDKYPKTYQVAGRHHDQPPRRHRRRPARPRDRAGRVRADLRPDLRVRETAPAQEGDVRRPRSARHHQRPRLRRLRRLLGAVELRLDPADRDLNSVASARSTNPAATRISAASRGSAPPS
jgi:indolepyruvate ferredoxin oxidoreductase